MLAEPGTKVFNRELKLVKAIAYGALYSLDIDTDMGESCASIQRKKLDFFLTSNSEIQSAKLCSSTIGRRCHVLETLSASNNVDNNFISSDVAYSSSRKVQSNHINDARHYNMAAHTENSCSDKVYPAPKIKNGHVSHSACYANPDVDTSVFMYQYSNSKTRLLTQSEYVGLVPTSDVSENFADETCTSVRSIHFSPPEKSIHKNGFKTYISTALKDDSLVDSSTYENSMSKRVSKIKIRSSKDNVLSNSTQPVCHNKVSNNALDKYYSKNNSEMTTLIGEKQKKPKSISSYDKAVTTLTRCSSSAGRKIVTNNLTPDNTPRAGVPCPNNLPILEEMRLPITSSDSSTNSAKKQSSEKIMSKWCARKIKQQRVEEKRRNFIKNRMLLKEQEKKKKVEASTTLWLENKIKESIENKKKEKERKAKELKEKQEKLELKEIEKKKVDLWYKHKEEALLSKFFFTYINMYSEFLFA